MNTHARHRGFSLVEVLLAIGILGVGMAMVAAIFPVAAKEAQDSSNSSLGNIMCNNALATLKAYLTGGERESGTLSAIATISGNTTILTDATKTTWTPNKWAGCYAEIISGTGQGQSGKIATSTASNATTPLVPNTLTVSGVFNPLPDTTSKYRIIQPRQAADSGYTSVQIILTTNTYFTDLNKNWCANQWVNWYVYSVLANGTGYMKTKIVANTASILASDKAGCVVRGDYGGGPGSPGRPYQFILEADENQNTDVINPDILRFPSGLSATNTSRGCLVFATKPLVSAEAAGTVPANMSSANGAIIIVVAYNKASRANKVAWGDVLVSGINNTDPRGPVVTIATAPTSSRDKLVSNPAGTLAVGSPLIFIETGAVAKIIKKIDNTNAILDRPIYPPRNTINTASYPYALVVQEVPPATGQPAQPTTTAYTGTPLVNSPAIAWQVSQTGSR